MSKRSEELDNYMIPQNFADSGTIAGGSIPLRNAIEAGGFSILLGLFILKLPFAVTTKIIIACLVVLPVALVSIIGINGESITAFFLHFILYLKNRRIVSALDTPKSEQVKKKRTKKNQGVRKPKEKKENRKRRGKDEDFFEEFGQIKEERKKKDKSATPQKKKQRSNEAQKKAAKEPEYAFINPVAAYVPIKKVMNGTILTMDNRYVKVIEVIPVNFLLRSAREQRNIIYAFISYLKVSPVRLQFKVLTKPADINRHLEALQREMEAETDERCIALQEDYINLIRRIGQKETVSRRFFIAFEYESVQTNRKVTEQEAVFALMTAAQTAKDYLRQCGNAVLQPENEDEFVSDLYYQLLNRNTSVAEPLSYRANKVLNKYVSAGREKDVNQIPVSEFIAPEEIDFRHSNYIIMDGVYHSYLLIPSNGYRYQVMGGWLSLFVNAGEGIDMDLFLSREPKDRIQRIIGQKIRINRSKIRDASDTNSDFDDLDSAIRSGYYLKSGLSGSEDFYYMNLLLTITADSLDELEWRIGEMKKLLLSQDMEASSCYFQEEQAFLSALPLVSLNKSLFSKSKRNLLTSSAASCYPFTSYELSDENGILLGVNQHNNSLVIVDIFNSRIYKNANISILGTSGAGKTFLIQLMALRMRRKNIQVFIVAPLKGHEFYRSCKNIGGEFIQISPASKNCINIMEIRKIDTTNNDLLDGTTNDKSALASKIQRLHIFFSLLIPDMNHEEKQLLDEALIQTYYLKGITHNNETLFDEQNQGNYKEMPLLEDVYHILIKNQDTKRLANILNRLVHGSASSFNQHTNVSLENKYTVLDISELTGDLLTVGMFVALDYVWDKAKEDRTLEKAIFMDELWKLIGASSNAMAAEFVLEIFKIIRGYGGSAICGTQDLNDYFALENGKYGKGIINNSKTKIVLNLEEDEAERVQSILNLSEAETMAITRFERGSGLISTNSNNVMVEFKASQLEKELITTDRNDLKELLKRKKGLGSL